MFCFAISTQSFLLDHGTGHEAFPLDGTALLSGVFSYNLWIPLQIADADVSCSSKSFKGESADDNQIPLSPFTRIPNGLLTESTVMDPSWLLEPGG